MKYIHIKLYGYGPLYHVYKINKPQTFSINRLPSEMSAVDIISKSAELAVVSDYYIEIRENGQIISESEELNFVHIDSFNFLFPFPAAYYLMDCVNVEQIFKIDLMDDETFDPKKVQYIQCDNSLPISVHGIIPYHILYDGKLIQGTTVKPFQPTDRTVPFDGTVTLDPKIISSQHNDCHMTSSFSSATPCTCVRC